MSTVSIHQPFDFVNSNHNIPLIFSFLIWFFFNYYYFLISLILQYACWDVGSRTAHSTLDTKDLSNGRMMPSVLASTAFLMMLDILAATALSVDDFGKSPIITSRSLSWVVTTALIKHINSVFCMVSINRVTCDPNGRKKNRMALQMVFVIIWIWQCLKPHEFCSHAFNIFPESCMVLLSCWNPVLSFTNMVNSVLDWHFLGLNSA